MSLQLEQDSPAATPRREGARASSFSPRVELSAERLRAPFSLRCGALLIDYILVVGVLAFATMLARVFGDARRGSAFVLTAGYIAVGVVAFLNFVVVAGLSGRTPRLRALARAARPGLRADGPDARPRLPPRRLQLARARAARPPRRDGRRAQPRAAHVLSLGFARLRERRMQTHCPSCGAETFPGARFCRRCGAPVRDAVGEGTGDVSPVAATVPLREEGRGRKTDGLAPGEERASAETTRVSRADVEHLLRPQKQDAGDQNRLDPDATVAQLGRDTLVGARARDDGDAAPDPEATIPARPAVTRPDAPAGFEHGEELTVTVPRPVPPTEAREAPADFVAALPASSATLRRTTRDAPAFEPGAHATSTRESATPAPPSPDGHAFVQTPGVHAPAAPRRRRWPLVVAVCAAALLFTVAAAWLAVRFLRRPPATETATQAPSA